MPKPTLVPRSGWRGVGDYAVRALRERAQSGPLALAHTLVLAPTAAAVHLFRAQLEDALLADSGASLIPNVATETTLLQEVTDRLVDPLLREALLEQSFRQTVESGLEPPFALRGGLATRVLDFYDTLHSGASEDRLDDFASRALEELEAPGDEGAERMAAQTRFLRKSLEAYREALARLDRVDLPGARRLLRDATLPYDHVLVLGGDTLTPAALDSLSKATGPEHLEVVTPEPGEHSPRLIAPMNGPALHFESRDREESLVSVARLLKVLEGEGRLGELHRVAVVVPRPLPYLYLAKRVFGEAGIPFELQDSFPLATAPYVAAFDLILELAETDADRASALALLRSPFFRFDDVGVAEVAAFDELTLRYREPGGLRRFKSLYERKRRPPTQPKLRGLEMRDDAELVLPALAALIEAREALEPLLEEGPLTVKIGCLRSFLDRYDAKIQGSEHARARGAITSILDRLSEAAQRVSDRPIDFASFRQKLRRAIESHTFARRSGAGGVTIVDASSAGFGAFDLVILLGLNEGEWPRRGERNIFYPSWLLREFGWPSDKELLAGERSSFQALLDLSGRELVLFRHQLEDELPTVTSPFLEELDSWLDRNPLSPERLTSLLETTVVTKSEALRRGLVEPELERMERRAGDVSGPLKVREPLSPTAVELYLRCPFKYFSRYLLGLEEEEDVDEALTPVERGRILHDLLQTGFEEWDRGRDVPRPIEPDSYEEALALFRRVAKEKIPPEHRRLELAWLFGGVGEPGAIEWLLRREMSRGPLKRRLVEHGFQTALKFSRGPSGETPWFVRIKGRVDRADVDHEGYLHVFDYKSGRAPEVGVTLQVPLYAMCLSQELGAPVREAAYLGFRDRKATSRTDFERASEKMLEAYAAIQKGRFGPRPAKEQLCFSCGYVGLCRKEIQEAER